MLRTFPQDRGGSRGRGPQRLEGIEAGGDELAELIVEARPVEAVAVAGIRPRDDRNAQVGLIAVGTAAYLVG